MYMHDGTSDRKKTMKGYWWDKVDQKPKFEWEKCLMFVIAIVVIYLIGWLLQKIDPWSFGIW